MTNEIKERIIKAYEKLNSEKPTEKQVEEIYNSMKDCGLL